MTNAWLGWKNYISDGKLAALLLAALIFLWFNRKSVERRLLMYTAGMTVCCIFPVTAVLLMKYQTRFYDYQWIWSMVPVTAVTAYGITFFLAEYWKDFKAAYWRKGLPVTLLLLAAILFCGGMGGQTRESGQRTKEHQARVVLDRLLEICTDENICLWAPQEIMEYARETSGRIRLPYGRNMWDISLNGYTYDIYDEKTTILYQWMSRIENPEAADSNPAVERETAEGIVLEECVQYASGAGVDCILLPPDTEPETVRGMEEILGIKAETLEGYWLYYGWIN